MRDVARRWLRAIRRAIGLETIATSVAEAQRANDNLRRLAAVRHDETVAAIELTRQHTEEAVQAAIDHVLTASREHTEAAVEAAVSAAVAAARQHAEAAASDAADAARAAAREHADAAAAAALASAIEYAAQQRVTTTRELAALRRATRQPAVAANGEPPAVIDTGIDTGTDTGVEAAFYAALEDRFRGSPDLIAARQEPYVRLVAELADDQHPVADLGCGRGEWLRLLRAHDIAAFGIDTNLTFVDEATADGLDVRAGDLVEFLDGQPDASLGAITMFQVVEHVPFAVLLRILTEAVRVLRPGGVLIAETPNALNLRVAASQFWLDPTHQRPLHPHLLEFAAEYCGFAKVEGWFVNPLGERAAGAAPVDRFTEAIDGPGDYALIAWA